MIKAIFVDFDGTICKDAWPDCGAPNHKVIYYILKKKAQGCKLILWTCRTGKQLEEAVKWCSKYGIIFDAINENLPELIEMYGGDTRKITADEYIDDKNVIVGPEVLYKEVLQCLQTTTMILSLEDQKKMI